MSDITKACEYLAAAKQKYEDGEIEWAQGDYIVTKDGEPVAACLVGCLRLVTGKDTNDYHGWSVPAMRAADYLEQVLRDQFGDYEEEDGYTAFYGPESIPDANDDYLTSEEDAVKALALARERCIEEARS